MDKKKNRRQAMIIHLVESEDVRTQEELVQKLNENGIPATQSTVSRDIRELKLSKAPDRRGDTHYVFQLDREDDTHLAQMGRFLSGSFLGADVAGNLVVVHTMEGMAMAVAASIDALKLKGCLGTIAGDDTIFLAAATEKDAKRILEKVKSMI